MTPPLRAIVGLLAALAGAVALGLPGARAQETQPAPLADPEAYAVYAAVLRAEWSDRIAYSKRLVVQQETRTDWRCVPSGKALDGDWKPVMDDFRRETASIKLLQPGFGLGIPYIVLPSSEILERIHDVPESPWSGFYEKYFDSPGYMSVSSVGFDPPKQRAMAYVENSCGRLCGRGALFFLEKIGGAWRVVGVPGVTGCFWSF